MPIDINKMWIYRIIHIKNLEHDLMQGLHCKNADETTPGYITIGSTSVIGRRDKMPVKCYPRTVVNDYVPFYFSKRTPMLLNIITGWETTPYQQHDIIYLCFKFSELATENLEWCYTDGNAADAITQFFTSIEGIETNIDWHSIETTDFREKNAEGDRDRKRKKHAEFLVRTHVPADYIRAIVVMNEAKKREVEEIVDRIGREIKVYVNPRESFYFL